MSFFTFHRIKKYIQGVEKSVGEESYPKNLPNFPNNVGHRHYFVFCGYRVAIGKAKNLHDRLGYYRRIGHDRAEILAVKDNQIADLRNQLAFF